MDTKNISNLLLKVGGMLIILMNLAYFPSYVYEYARYPEKSLSLFMSILIMPNILPLAFGAFIFLRPEKITNKFIQENSGEAVSPPSASLLQIEQICLSTLGFFLLFQSISDLVLHTAKFVQAKVNSPYMDIIANSLIFTPTYIATIAELLFALWLIFKTKGIVKFINKIRAAGRK